MTALGGNGSTYMLGRTPEPKCKRPDVTFGHKYDLDSYPRDSIKLQQEYCHRSGGVTLNSKKTINDNLMNCVNREDFRVVFFQGNCSSVKPFLARNGIKASCIARNPVRSYNSYMRAHGGKQKKNARVANAHGGITSYDCAKWYTSMWNNIVYDMLESGSKCFLYEHYLPIYGWNPSGRETELPLDIIELITRSTCELYGQFKERAKENRKCPMNF